MAWFRWDDEGKDQLKKKLRRKEGKAMSFEKKASRAASSPQKLKDPLKISSRDRRWWLGCAETAGSH